MCLSISVQKNLSIFAINLYQKEQLCVESSSPACLSAALIDSSMIESCLDQPTEQNFLHWYLCDQIWLVNHLVYFSGEFSANVIGVFQRGYIALQWALGCRSKLKCSKLATLKGPLE